MQFSRIAVGEDGCDEMDAKREVIDAAKASSVVPPPQWGQVP